MSNSNQLTVLQYASRDFMALPKDLRQRGQNLMWELEKSAEAFDAFIAEVKQELEQRRDEAHEAAVRAVRKQMEAVEAAEQKVEKAEFAAQAARNALSTANAQLHVALASKPKRFPLKEETAAWEAAVQMARDIHAKCEQKALEANSWPMNVRGELAQAQFTLRELEEKEFELRPKQEQKPSPIGGLGWSGIAGPTNSFGLGGEI
jgi:predicted trehalose synthase